MSLLAKRKHFYDIKKSATNYVNAIAKYGKKVSIDVIDGTPVDGGHLNCDNIQGVLERSQKENFVIECSSSNNDSTLGAFPLLDTEKLRSDVPREMIESPSKTIEQSKKLISYQLNRLKGPAYEVGKYKNPDPLTQQEATFLLTQLQDEYKDDITGAIHLPQHQAILFQFNARETANFLLHYGEKTSFKQMSELLLDIDDGFKVTQESSADDRSICYELNKHFKRWTASKYEGELIPSRNSGFQCYRDAASFDPSRNIHSFWQMPSPGAVLVGAGMVALAATACVSYINRVK